MTDTTPRYVHVADTGVLVEFATEISDAVSDLVLHADSAIAAAAIEGVVEIVPAMVNVLVVFDPLMADHDSIQAGVELALQSAPGSEHEPNEHVVEVCYAPSLGIDLAAVAAELDMSVQALIASHLASSYRVCM